MIRRIASLALLGGLAGTPAWAQPPSPASGSVTVFADPAGCRVKLIGVQMIEGHAPFTLSRGLAGHYTVAAEQRGYEAWRRTIVLDGASSDTVWIKLRAKTPFLAGLRSAVLPGWGQFYDSRTGRGWLMLGMGAVAGGAALWTEVEYSDRVDDGDDPASVEEARNDRQLALTIAVGVWAFNVLDSVFLFEGPRHSYLRAGVITPPGTGDHLLAVGIERRF
jgi:hypothetical protein